MRILFVIIGFILSASGFADTPDPALVKTLIILDAGHGGHDEGTAVQMLQEKRIALMCSLMVRNFLDEMGYRVILTRTKDVYLSLPRRVSIANSNRGACFVSIHFNAASNAAAKGIEVFYCDNREQKRTRASQKLANCILYHVIDETNAKSRGVKKGNHHVTRETQMPAVLVEGGFLTNREERVQLKTKIYIEKIARGIAEGIDKFMKS
jgi:N-acetylmuramoyl-L-alanine amidase